MICVFLHILTNSIHSVETKFQKLLMFLNFTFQKFLKFYILRVLRILNFKYHSEHKFFSSAQTYTLKSMSPESIFIFIATLSMELSCLCLAS